MHYLPIFAIKKILGKQQGGKIGKTWIEWWSNWHHWHHQIGIMTTIIILSIVLIKTARGWVVFKLAPHHYLVPPLFLQQQTSQQAARASKTIFYMIWLTRQNAAKPRIIDLTLNNTTSRGGKHWVPIRKLVVTIIVFRGKLAPQSWLLGGLTNVVWGWNFKDAW